MSGTSMKKKKNSENFHVGRLIQAARKSRGLSQKELAFLMGLGPQSISDMENRECVRTDSLAQIADCLEYEIALVPRPKKKKKVSGHDP